MFRKLLVLFFAVAVPLVGVPQAAPKAAEPPSFMVGVNYYEDFWKPDASAVLTQLPLNMVRSGGNISDRVPMGDSFVALFGNVMHASKIEPLFQVSLLNSKPEQAAKLVKYVNIDQKAGIKYWSIGNEPELFRTSHKNDISLEDYLTKYRQIAEAMRAADPSIILVGPDVSIQMTPLDKSSRAWQWWDAFMKTNGDLIQMASFHFYPFYVPAVPRDQLLANPDTYAKSLTEMRAYLKETLKRDIPLMVTEANLNSNPQTTGDHGGDSLFAGLWMAEIAGISAQQGLVGLLAWNAVGGGNLSMIDMTYKPRPTYYGLQMFANYGKALPDPNSSVDGVKVYASTTEKGLIVVLVNRNEKPVTLNLGKDISLDKDHAVPGSVTLGGYSMTRLEFDTAAKFTAGTTFGQTENDAKSGPVKVVLQ